MSLVQDARYCLTLSTNSKIKDCVSAKGIPISYGSPFKTVKGELAKYIESAGKVEEQQALISTVTATSSGEDDGMGSIVLYAIIGAILVLIITLYFVFR